MRNASRIERTLNLLSHIWFMQNDLRFNQLVHNLQNEYAYKNGHMRGLWEKEEYRGIVTYHSYAVADLFNLEDEVFIEFLEEKVRELHNE
jgi:hypothetical protein